MRHTLRSLISGYKKFGKWNNKELLDLLITSLASGFIFSFTRWGDAQGNWSASIGLYNWFIYSVFSLIVLFIMHFGIRFSAVEMGYKPEYKKWNLGIIISLAIVFLTNGAALMILPGGFIVKTAKGMQIGKFFKGINYRELGYLVFWGFFSLVLFLTLSKILLPNIVSKEIITVAYVIAFWSLFPIDIFTKIYIKEGPISNGTYLFFSLPWAFGLFTLIFLISSCYFIVALSKMWPVIVSLILAIIVYFIFYLFYEPTKKIL